MSKTTATPTPKFQVSQYITFRPTPFSKRVTAKIDKVHINHKGRVQYHVTQHPKSLYPIYYWVWEQNATASGIQARLF